MAHVSVSLFPIDETYISLFIDDTCVVSANTHREVDVEVSTGKHTFRAIQSRCKDYTEPKAVMEYGKPTRKEKCWFHDRLIIAAKTVTATLVTESAHITIRGTVVFRDQICPGTSTAYTKYGLDMVMPRGLKTDTISSVPPTTKAQKAMFRLIFIARNALAICILPAIFLFLTAILISKGKEIMYRGASGYECAFLVVPVAVLCTVFAIKEIMDSVRWIKKNLEFP